MRVKVNIIPNIRHEKSLFWWIIQNQWNLTSCKRLTNKGYVNKVITHRKFDTQPHTRRQNFVHKDYFHIPSRVHFMKFMKIALDWSRYRLVNFVLNVSNLNYARCVNPLIPWIGIFKIDFPAFQCKKSMDYWKFSQMVISMVLGW